MHGWGKEEKGKTGNKKNQGQKIFVFIWHTKRNKYIMRYIDGIIHKLRATYSGTSERLIFLLFHPARAFFALAWIFLHIREWQVCTRLYGLGLSMRRVQRSHRFFIIGYVAAVTYLSFAIKIMCGNVGMFLADRSGIIVLYEWSGEIDWRAGQPAGQWVAPA